MMTDSHIQAIVALAFMLPCAYMATGKKMPADARLLLEACAWLLAWYAAWCLRDKIGWLWPATAAIGLIETGFSIGIRGHAVAEKAESQDYASLYPSRQGG